MGIFKTIGKGLRKGIGFVGDVAKTAAPFAGLIPGAGTLVGAGLGLAGSAGSDFGHKRKFSVGNALKSGAMGAASGFAGSKLLGGKGIMGKLGGVAKSKGPMGIMSGIKATQPQQGLFGKIGGVLGSKGFQNAAGAGLGAMSAIGQHKQNKQANAYNDASTALRNQLFQRLLEKPNYNFQPGA